MRASVADSHWPTKAIHCRTASVGVLGWAPAPMDPGLKKAAMALSEALPGPQVPPAAGAGSGRMAAVRR